MLVHFCKRILLEGEAVRESVKKPFKKSTKEVRKIGLPTTVKGVCDESEVEYEVERLTKLALSNTGYGEGFSGWKRVVPFEEWQSFYEELNWTFEPLNDITIVEYISTWPMDKILKTLTGRQFITFLIENGSGVYRLKEDTYV